jgi:hypothetical protein
MQPNSWTTLGIALLGLCLGVLNSYFVLSSRRVKLRVTPSWSIASGFTGLSIDVVNLSHFPVTVTEIGLTLDDDRGSLPRRMPIPEERIVNGIQAPTKLERGESKSISFLADNLEPYRIRRAYTLTSSGTIFRGTSGALKQFITRGNKVI